MFTGDARKLSFPLSRTVTLTQDTPDEDICSDLPAFPEDSDERIAILFNLSLNEFVALASAIDAGRDLSHPLDSVLIWWIWSRGLDCMTICERVAECLNENNEALINALAAAMTTNQVLINALAQAEAAAGGGIPGQPISQNQAQSDTLPANAKDGDECVPDSLWGACLYLVQAANRAIVDVFDIFESASNTLERMDIAAGNIPAIGTYVASAAAFADQIAEELAEGYAAAYTELYEEDLACAIFCLARAECELTPDMLVALLADRLEQTTPDDFGQVAIYIAGGGFTGTEIADVAMFLFFTALKFGSQFGGTVGIRPLNIIMSLGADQLASDNWIALCPACVGAAWSHDFDFTGASMPTGWEVYPDYGVHVPGVGVIAGALGGVLVRSVAVDGTVNAITLQFSVPNSSAAFTQVLDPSDSGSTFTWNFEYVTASQTSQSVGGLPETFDDEVWRWGVLDGGTDAALTGCHVSGEGVDPYV